MALCGNCGQCQVAPEGTCPECGADGPGRAAETARRSKSRANVSAARIAAADRDGEALYGAPHPVGTVDDDEPEETARLAPVPKFPVGDLVGPLADLVGSTEFPAPLVAGWGLGILAGLSGLADVTIEDSLPLAGPLWIMAIAKRGRGKTPSFDYAARELRALEVAERREWQRAMADWRTMDPEVRGDLPADPLRMFDDVTLEGTARLLNRRDGTGLIPVDELAGWVGRMGRYGNAGGGSERARWLSMWSAQPWTYQRVGDAKGGGLAVDIFIERPVVSIVGGIQPGLLSSLGSDTDGFPPRWLPFWYDGPKLPWAKRLYVPAQWEEAVRRLYAARSRREWSLSGAGLDLWRAACARWAEQAEGDEASATSAALDKADIQCAAVSKVIAESLYPGRGGVIPVEAVTCAVAITDYAMDCWRAMPGNETISLSRKDDALNRGVDQLKDWLEDRAPREFNGRMVRWSTVSEIRERHVAGVRTSPEAHLLADRYAQVWPGHVVDYKPPTGRPGRAVIAPQRDESSALFRERVSGQAGNSAETGGQRTGDVMTGQRLAIYRRTSLTSGRKPPGRKLWPETIGRKVSLRTVTPEGVTAGTRTRCAGVVDDLLAASGQ